MTKRRQCDAPVVNAKALSIMRYQDDIRINTEHNMKSICRAAVAQWTKRLTRNGQTRVRIRKAHIFDITLLCESDGKAVKAVNSVTFMEVDLEKLAEEVKVAEDQSLQSDEGLRLRRKFVIDIQHYITVLLSVVNCK